MLPNIGNASTQGGVKRYLRLGAQVPDSLGLLTPCPAWHGIRARNMRERG